MFGIFSYKEPVRKQLGKIAENGGIGQVFVNEIKEFGGEIRNELKGFYVHVWTNKQKEELDKELRKNLTTKRV